MPSYTARLSPADQVAPMSHTSVNWCFPSEDPHETVKLLREGLRRTVQQLPYLAGRVSRGNEQGFTTLSWTDGDEVELQEPDGTGLPSWAELAASRMCLHELNHEFRPKGIISREYVEKPGDSFPAMLAACTIVEGGVILCWSCHHHMVGGVAHVALLHRWANNTGGIAGELDAEYDAFAPLRRFEQVSEALGLKTAKPPPTAGTTKPTLSASPASGSATAKSGPTEKPFISITNRIFTVRIQQVDALREAIKAESGKGRPSRAVTLAAMMWCIITQIREQRKTTAQVNGSPAPTTLLMPVPADALFDQGTVVKSRNFIGNLLTAANTTETIANIAAKNPTPGEKPYPSTMAHAIQRVSTSLAVALSPKFISGVLQQICSLPDVRLLSTASSRGSNDLLVTAWLSFPVFPDFGPGVGRPTFLRPATEAARGGGKTNRAFYQYVVILPGPTGEDVIELLTCFEKGDMAELEKHPLMVRMQRGNSQL